MYNLYEVLSKEKVCDGYYTMTFRAPELARQASPGQFIMLKAWEGCDPYLMRPISLNRISPEEGTIGVLFKTAGRGTQLLSERAVGETVRILGPQGRGFPETDAYSRIAVIARGVGAAPMFPLAELCRRRGVSVYAYLSAKNMEQLFDRDALEGLGVQVRFSAGDAGLITDAFAEDCKTLRFDAAFCCGSMRLAREAKRICGEYGFPGYISMEERMGCGVGACKGCACREQNPDGKEVKYAYVCKDGPVFPIERIVE